VRLSARKGILVVRRGKGDAHREVHLNADARAALETWIAERERFPEASQTALFLNRTGGRLSARSIDEALRRVGWAAGVALSAHVLRHTCLTKLVCGGNDIVLVAEIAGHRRLETTRRYSLPSAADRQAAMEGLRIDY
jgi:site-specific recombinase XerD